MAVDIKQLLNRGDDAMSREDLGAADAAFSDALKACLDKKTEHRDVIVGSLTKLAGQFIKRHVNNRPEALYDYIDQQPAEEKSRLLEILAELYRDYGDLASSEQMYIQIFQLRAVSVGYSHETTMSALQTAALLTQMQGKSPEDLYKQAYQGVHTKQAEPAKKEPAVDRADVATAVEEKSPAAEEKKSDQEAAGSIEPGESTASPQGPAPAESPKPVEEPPTEPPADKPPPRKPTLPTPRPGSFLSGAFSVDDLFAGMAKMASQSEGTANTPEGAGPPQTPTEEISVKNIPSREELKAKREADKAAAETEKKPLSKADGVSFAGIMAEAAPHLVTPEESANNPEGKFDAALEDAFDGVLAEPSGKPQGKFDTALESAFDGILAEPAVTKPEGKFDTALENAFDWIMPEPATTNLEDKFDTALENAFDGIMAEPATTNLEGKFDTALENAFDGIMAEPATTNPEGKFDSALENAFDGILAEPIPSKSESKFDTALENAFDGIMAEPTASTHEGKDSALEDAFEGIMSKPAANTSAGGSDSAIDPIESAFSDFTEAQPTPQAETATSVAPAAEQKRDNGTPKRLGALPSAIARSTVVPIEQVGSTPAKGNEPESAAGAPLVPAEVSLLWKVMGRSLNDRIAILRKQFRDSADVIAVDRIMGRPSFYALIDREKQPSETKRGLMSDRLDLNIATALLPVYEEQSFRAYELTLIYGLLVRAELLHPLHPDIAQNVFRLGHLWLTDEACDDTFEMARSALVLSHELTEHLHGESSEGAIYNGLCLARANALCGDANSAKFVFERAYDLSLQERIYSRPQLLEILQEFARTCRKAKLHDLAAETYEKIRAMHEEVSNNSPELFETLVELVTAYNNAGDLEKAEEYHKRLTANLEWSNDANTIRALCAARYEELEAYFHAEQLNKDLLCNCVPTNPLMGKAVQSLIRVYEKWGRHRDAERLRNPQRDPDKDRPPPHMVTDPSECMRSAALALKASNPFEAGQYYATILVNAKSGDSVASEALKGLRDIAIGYWHDTKLDSAAACYASACEQAERLFGIAHEDTVVLLHESGLLAAQRKLPCLTHFEKAYEGRAALLGTWHPETAESAFETAHRLDDVNNAGRKEKLLRSAIAARSYSVGILEDRTQQYLSELIHLYELIGFRNSRRLAGWHFDSVDEPEITETSPGYVITARASTLPITLETLDSLIADIDTLKKSCGLTDKVTLLALNKLVDMYSVEGGELWANIPATTHLEAALICETYGLHFLAEGDFKNSEAMFACAFKIRETVMGNSHPDTAVTLMHMGKLHALKKDFAQSLNSYKQALEIAKETLGAHITTLCMTHNMAWLFQEQGRFAEAKDVFQQVSESLKTIGNAGILPRQTCKNNLVMMTMKMGGSA